MCSLPHINSSPFGQILSAQQLPRRKDSGGREIINSNIIDPYVEVTIHVPDWTRSPFVSDAQPTFPASSSSQTQTTKAPSATSTSYRTSSVKNNGFNPRWSKSLSLPLSDVVASMQDLIFIRFAVHDERSAGSSSSSSTTTISSEAPLAVYCCSLGSMQMGYRHLPLLDA